MSRGLKGKNRVYGRCSSCKEPHDPCPMGCGLLTDDCAGGPCSECWEMAE